ncbi:MAG: hypothetical protein QOK46_1219, partial [Microbacteriaceae bacterium]|nr:hypothetical protein [Microbacteriaceae bacterium]
ASMNADNIYQPIAQLAENALGAIEDPGSGVAIRIREMAEYFRFMERRMPELLEEWEELRRSK